MAEPADGKRLITLFGGAAIQVGAVPLGGRATHRHPLALIALLVANGGRPLTRDKLIGLLWPERDADAARNLLKVNVHELRKEIGEAAIRSTGDQLSADPGALSCDVADFLAALGRGDDRAAAESYTGPFLDGFFLKDAAEFERWVETERARFAGMYSAALDRLAIVAEQAGDHEAAVRWRRAHATHDPYHPDVAHRYMEALAASGDRAGAIKFAESFVQRRRDDLEISDDHNIVKLARQLSGTYSLPPKTDVIPSAARDPGSLGSEVPREGSHDAQLAQVPRSARDDKLRWIAVVAAAIVLVAVAVVWRQRNTSAAAAAAPSRVAVMPFRVVGSDTAMRDGLVDLLAARFNGEGGAQSVDPLTVVQSWRSASAKNGPPSLDAAIAMVRGLGATQLVAGEIVSARDSVAIAARLYAVPSGALLASARADASSGTSLARLADRVAIELMARAAGEPADRLGDLVERPLPSARKYIAGQLAYRSAQYAAAESLYAQALGDDSTFGAAGLGLALANSWTGINDHYGKGRDAALHNRSTLSERDRAFFDAFFGPDPALGPPRPAPDYLSAWEDVVEKWPDWTEAWYQLGDRYYHFGGLSGLADPGERARTAFRRALSQDSTFAAPLHHLVELYAARGEAGELRAASSRYFSANPAVDRDRSAMGWETAMALGDSAWLRRIRANFEQMPREDLTRIGWVTDVNGWPRDDAERAASLVNRKSTVTSEHEKALILLFSLSLNGGRPTEARVAAAGLGAVFPDRPVGALWDLYAALFGDGDTTLAADAAKRLAPFANAPVSGDHVLRDQHHVALCLAGYRSAVRGELATARAALDRVRADLRTEDNNFALRNGHVCAAMLSSAIAAGSRSGDAKRLVAQLDTILLRERVPPHAILEAGTLVAARLHAALGDTAAALVATRRREHLTGDPLFLASQLRDEVRYAAAMGDTAGAARAVAHLRALRRNAEAPR